MRTCQVGVVRRVDEVVRQRLVHVLAQVEFLRRDQRVLRAQQILEERFLGEVTCGGGGEVRLRGGWGTGTPTSQWGTDGTNIRLGRT